ncbi:MAG: hypothetical protein H7A37_08835 [Chlamydiales bacterium]|nr:hypothetical protein [Chlamydiia bacterium]MCP5508385.1 hypothetical protein [Chlamydiales bacterium]
MGNKIAIALCTIMFTTALAFAEVPFFSSSTTSGNNSGVLYVQTASEAIITKDQSAEDKFIITLKDVKPQIAFFAETPSLIIGKTTIQNFINDWTNTTTTTSTTTPNAALVTETTTPSSITLSDSMVVLSNPNYDARTGTLTYEATTTNGSTALQEGVHANPVIFIDSNCTVFCQ